MLKCFVQTASQTRYFYFNPKKKNLNKNQPIDKQLLLLQMKQTFAYIFYKIYIKCFDVFIKALNLHWFLSYIFSLSSFSPLSKQFLYFHCILPFGIKERNLSIFFSVVIFLFEKSKWFFKSFALYSVYTRESKRRLIFLI